MHTKRTWRCSNHVVRCYMYCWEHAQTCRTEWKDASVKTRSTFQMSLTGLAFVSCSKGHSRVLQSWIISWPSPSPALSPWALDRCWRNFVLGSSKSVGSDVNSRQRLVPCFLLSHKRQGRTAAPEKRNVNEEKKLFFPRMYILRGRMRHCTQSEALRTEALHTEWGNKHRKAINTE